MTTSEASTPQTSVVFRHPGGATVDVQAGRTYRVLEQMISVYISRKGGTGMGPGVPTLMKIEYTVEIVGENTHE